MDTNERIEIVLLKARLESTASVRRELQKRKWKVIPHDSTIRNIYRKFLATGSVHNAPKSGRPSIGSTKKDEIAEHFTENPRSSLRHAANDLHVSHTTIDKVLRYDLKMHPYKIQVTQQLHEEDHALRISMCEDLLEKIKNDVNFLRNIIFSDEATFRLNGCVNRHNCRIWGIEKPTETHQKSQSSPKINVWMGLSSTRIYGPHFFDENISGNNYLEMLQNKLLPALREHGYRNRIFQQDGAPAHYARIVRTFLDQHFPGRWLGRCGPMIWAARSPDLSPLDFFVWGFLKNNVYAKKPRDIVELKNLIIHESSKINPQMCTNAVSSFQKRLQLCIDLNGTNVENI